MKPLLIVTQPERKPRTETTWEQRQGYRDRSGAIIQEREAVRMTVSELIAFMGSSWAHHPAFVQKPRSLLPMPNLAGVQPCIQYVDARIRGQIKTLLLWAMR